MISGDQSKILRARLDWLAPVSTLAAADQRPGRYLLNDQLIPVDAVNGQPPVAEPDAWLGKVFEAFLQEEPAAIDGAVEFVVPLGTPASQVLLTARFLGLPLDQGVSVWLNGDYVGELRPQVPSLNDAGYVLDESGGSTYAGWRSVLCSSAPRISSRVTTRSSCLRRHPASMSATPRSSSVPPRPGPVVPQVSSGDSVDLDSQNLDLSP